jgi:hypothetical protein
MRFVPTSVALAGLIASALFALAQTSAPKAGRAQPPKFTKIEPYFADAFKEALVGARPADLNSAAAASGSGSPASAAGATLPPAGGSGWSRLISAATIEDTIKSVKLQVDKQITTPSDFAGKGHKLARRDFSLLAMLFGIAGEYDGDVRWKKDAPAARDAFARSAANFKVGTTQAFQEARLRKEELADLVSGSSPFAGKEADTKAAWATVAGRSPLMQYLEAAWDARLKPALADKAQFTAKADLVLKEAELFAAIGEVLQKPGMPDADSDEYLAFAAKLRDSGQQILDAVKSKNYEQASAASAIIGKSCVECHENYRS